MCLEYVQIRICLHIKTNFVQNLIFKKQSTEGNVTCEWGRLPSGAVAAAAGDNGRPFIEAVGCRYNVWSQECAGTGPGIKYHLP